MKGKKKRKGKIKTSNKIPTCYSYNITHFHVPTKYIKKKKKEEILLNNTIEQYRKI